MVKYRDEGVDRDMYVSPYLTNELRILRDVCRAMGRDEDGRHCPDCCLRDICDAQAEKIRPGAPA